MGTSQENGPASISGAFFCPQAGAPDEEYLNGLHSFLSQHKQGQSLLREVSNLKNDKIWSIFAEAREDIANLSPGPEYVDMLYDWAVEGVSKPLAAARSGIVALPLLVILQVGQYLRYLDYHGLSHQAFLVDVRKAGGLQGYCGGLPSAIAIGCAVDEVDVVKHTATAVRIMLGVGAYGEAADDTRGSGSTTLALRLKYEGQGEELTQRFANTHVSAITEPRSISIVGPAGTLHELFVFAREQERLQVQKMDIRGKVHNPDNADLAAEFCQLCSETPCLQLPDALELQAPVRSNRSGRRLSDGSLTRELVTTILASRCEWYNLLIEVAKDMKESQNSAPAILYFGLTDCVSLTPFIKQGLRPIKIAAHSLIPRIAKTLVKDELDFPEDAIAVIGASCRLPGANNLEELWEMLASGTDGHRPLNNDRVDLYGSFRASQSGNFTKERNFYGNFIDDVQRFDNGFFGVNPREAASMDPQQRILLEVAYEALDDAGYLATHHREDGDNVGCFIGGSLVEYLDNTNSHAPTAYTSTGTIRAFLCGRLSYYFGWSGPAEVIDTACSASLVAINRACKAIQAGECRMALAGGVNIITGMNNFFDLAKAGFLSPTGQCKPFDVTADGYCRSDGAGLVVLKKLSRAVADGDAILGVIPGITTNQGGLSTSITVPQSAAQQALYRKVLQQARIPPESVTYVEAHGTGTQAGDPLEMESVRSIFGRKASTLSHDSTLYIGSIKGNLGHCETAAGVVGLLKVLTMIKHIQVPPQANHNKLNPKIAPLEPDGLAITRSLRGWNVPFRAALVNSYGAAGSNCALLCCEMPSQQDLLKKKSEEIKLPLIISAASEKSLLQNARALSAHLRKHSSDLNLDDVAYTLKERRKRLKFLATIEARSVQDAATMLESLQSASISQQLSQPPTPVVLVFSGQFDNKVRLGKAVYDSLPAFRYYIDACDRELQAQGFPSIMPTIFESEPARNAMTLQCSIFAMQYASAKCWIDSGLHPSAVVGHSLGELTALAVSGILSLPDAIKLVASRAQLIDAKWGPEKGSMLALGNCSTQDFEAISSLLQQKTRNLVTIACYNATNSIVAAGTSTAINHLEELLRAEPEFQKIRTRRLATSHGFHSHLVEPLLDDLVTLSQSLEWSEPKIPLEMCSNSPIDSFKRYDPSKHLREPVFFVDAVKRLEERFGSALWLEAGIDTPAIAMTRAASGQADSQTFLALKTTDTRNTLDSLTDLVSNLWRNGQFVNHWRLISTTGEPRRCKPIWLPPYQFDRTPHWLPNVDRVMEMQQTMLKNVTTSIAPVTASHASPPPPPKLVSNRQGMATSTHGRAEFTVNTQSQRFSQIVSGHCVRSRSLCPASMYMESVVMAVQLLTAEGVSPTFAPGANVIFEEVHFHAPLGANVKGEVIVRLDPTLRENSWKFAICTLFGDSSSSSRPQETVHGKGVVSLDRNALLDAWQRLLPRPMEIIGKAEWSDAERFMSKRTYNLFSRVVDYSSFFHGIHSLVLHEREAVASIRMPEEQPAREESTAWGICDTVTIDSFIQVVGFIMNTSDFVAADEVAVMVGLDRAVISPKCDFSGADAPSKQDWRVYARFGFDSNQQPVGDVFVFNTQDHDLVAVLTGCRFSKLPMSKLERSLDQAMRLSPPSSKQSMSVAQPPPKDSFSSSSSSLTNGTNGTSTPASSRATAEQHPSDQLEALNDLIAECTGIAKVDMTQDKSLAELGLDSLAAVELVGELSSKFNMTIASEDLSQSTLEDLFSKLGSGKISAAVSSPQSSTSSPNIASTTTQPNSQTAQNNLQKLKQILVDVVGADLEDIRPGAVLADLGIDSMSANDLQQELEDIFSIRVQDIRVDDTVESLMKQLVISTSPKESVVAASLPLGSLNGVVGPAVIAGTQGPNSGSTVILENPFEALKSSDAHFDTSARKQGFFNHWEAAAPYQDEILIAFITEGFATLGVDLSRTPPGSKLPQVPHLTQKYDKLVARLWEILQNHGLVVIDPAGMRTRGDRAVDGRSSSQLLTAFQQRFPGYRYESDLIGLTGPRLADCLSGKVDSVSLMFGNAASMKIMENFYGWSPMMSTLTDQLVVFLITLLQNLDKTRPVRILEVGAGTGGTTKRVLAAMASAGISATYTFTDIGPSLVSKAKTTLKDYNWIEYGTFNLEKEVPEAFRGRFDVVISTNCVHATTNRTNSCRRLRDTLVPGGIVVLSEVTRVIDWYDICFGLLDGWWLADGRTMYPIQAAENWMSVFKAAGFASRSHSGGPTPEATSQQLLVACNKQWDVPTVQGNSTTSFHMETMVFKEVSGVKIHADVFFPIMPLSSAMPVALMIHGGGHMTLSRKAVRPAQTKHLLANGFLPVSIDYRLCPEVTLRDGPIADVTDAYVWVQTVLLRQSSQRGFILDPRNVVVIGWSSGGHLALALGWMSKATGMPPPAAVLSFYAPVDFESGSLDSVRLRSLPGRTKSLKSIIATLPTQPITNYDTASKGDETRLGWVRPGDPRSELILALFKEKIGLSLLLKGLPPPKHANDEQELLEYLTTPPSSEHIASISPTARLRAGEYVIPTCIIHGTSDEVAPFSDAERFVAEMRERGIRCELLALKGVGHIHDVGLRPGMIGWEEGVAPGYAFLFGIIEQRRVEERRRGQA